MNNNTAVIIDMQGFKGENNKFIPKEIVISFNDYEYQHFLLKPPFPFGNLPQHLQIQANSLYTYHHGLKWNAGDIDVNSVKQFILCNCKNKNIYIKNEEKRQWLLHFLGKNISPNHVYELDSCGCPNINILIKQYININVKRCNFHKRAPPS